MREFRSLLLAKIETTYGVDPAPNPSLDAFRTSNPKIKVMGKKLEHNVTKAGYGKPMPMNVGEAIEVTFDAELYSDFSTGIAPKLGTLLRACNLTETIQAGGTNYSPNSNQEGESITIYVYQDGILKKISGCRGTVKFTAKVNEIALCAFTFQGLYSSNFSTDVAFPATMIIPSKAANIFRSAGAQINAYNGIISAFDLDLANVITQRHDANAATGVHSLYVSERDSKGSIDPEVSALASFNPFTLWDSESNIFMTIQVVPSGGGPGSITFQLQSVVLDIPGEGNRDTYRTYALPFSLHPTVGTGNDDLVIAFT